MVSRQVPWKEEGYSAKDVQHVVKRGERLKIPGKCPDFLIAIMTQCWKDSNVLVFIFNNCKEPLERPSFGDLLDLLPKSSVSIGQKASGVGLADTEQIELETNYKINLKKQVRC